MHHTRRPRAACPAQAGAIATALFFGLGGAAVAQVTSSDPLPPPPVLQQDPPQALPPSTPPAPGQGMLSGLLPATTGGAPLTPLAPRDPAEFNNADRPLLSLGNDRYYMKPILAIAGGIWGEIELNSANPGKESRVTTMALTRFGFEGRLGPYVSFRSEFERNIGRHGTGVWEGTASLNSRDNYVRLSRWGLILDAGIILDEASVDFFSVHQADMLLADKYTRDPLLYSGFNRGQGVKVSWGRWGLRVGFAYTEANPLSTSTSYQVGGAFAGGSRFWERPLGNFRVGQPDDDLQFRVLSPSVTYSHKWFELRGAAQVFNINYQASSKDDPNLFGYNLRASALGKIRFGSRVPVMITPFGNFATVRNQVLNSSQANTVLDTYYQAQTYTAGFDVFIKDRSGFGFSYAEVRDKAPSYNPAAPEGQRESTTLTIQTYINCGMTYWLTDYVAWGLRVAYYRFKRDLVPNEEDVSVFTTIRLVI